MFRHTTIVHALRISVIANALPIRGLWGAPEFLLHESAPSGLIFASLIRNELFVGMQDQLLQPPVVHVRDVQRILIGTGDAVNPIELPDVAA